MAALNASDACPAAEQLAALAEGRLRGRERDELLAHLRGCQDCFQSYTLALGLLAETRPSVTPARWRPRALAWGSLAAAALLFLALRMVSGPGPSGTPPPSLWDLADTVRQTRPSAVPKTPFEPWPTAAPAGHAFAPEDDTRALRLWGVRLADVEWSERFAPAAADDARGRLRTIERSPPSTPPTREAAALGWLVEWCRLSASAGSFELCPAAQPPASAALAGALDDPAARRLWNDVLRAGPPGDPAAEAVRERALRRLLEVLT